MRTKIQRAKSTAPWPRRSPAAAMLPIQRRLHATCKQISQGPIPIGRPILEWASPDEESRSRRIFGEPHNVSQLDVPTRNFEEAAEKYWFRGSAANAARSIRKSARRPLRSAGRHFPEGQLRSDRRMATQSVSCIVRRFPPRPPARRTPPRSMPSSRNVSSGSLFRQRRVTTRICSSSTAQRAGSSSTKAS